MVERLGSRPSRRTHSGSSDPTWTELTKIAPTVDAPLAVSAVAHNPAQLLNPDQDPHTPKVSVVAEAAVVVGVAVGARCRVELAEVPGARTGS